MSEISFIRPIYRHIQSKETFWGMDIFDMIVLSLMTHLLFRFNDGKETIVTFINLFVIGMTYLALTFIKRKLPKNYTNKILEFYIRSRILIPKKDTKAEIMGGL